MIISDPHAINSRHELPDGTSCKIVSRDPSGDYVLVVLEKCGTTCRVPKIFLVPANG